MTLNKAKQMAARAWCAPSTEKKTMDAELAFAFADILVNEHNKGSVKKLNAKNFFVELIHSLAPGKDLTPTQRSQYKRVLAFLDA